MYTLQKTVISYFPILLKHIFSIIFSVSGTVNIPVENVLLESSVLTQSWSAATGKCFRNATALFNPGLGTIRMVHPGQLALLNAKCIIMMFTLALYIMSYNRNIWNNRSM